jgi:hypothetical protein
MLDHVSSSSILCMYACMNVHLHSVYHHGRQEKCAATFQCGVRHQRCQACNLVHHILDVHSVDAYAAYGV